MSASATQGGRNNNDQNTLQLYSHSLLLLSDRMFIEFYREKERCQPTGLLEKNQARLSTNTSGLIFGICSAYDVVKL